MHSLAILSHRRHRWQASNWGTAVPARREQPCCFARTHGILMAWVQEASHKMRQFPTVWRLLSANAHIPEMFLPAAFRDTYPAIQTVLTFLLTDQCLSSHTSKNNKQSKQLCPEHFNFWVALCWVETGIISSLIERHTLNTLLPVSLHPTYNDPYWNAVKLEVQQEANNEY